LSKSVRFLLVLTGALFVGFLARAFLGTGISPVTAGVVAGVLATFSLGGVGYGLWYARQMEARRKAKEQIWMNL
jgi:hypothetical protein